MRSLALVAFATTLLIGCSRETPPKSSESSRRSVELLERSMLEAGRFLPLTGPGPNVGLWHGALALDSKTGQLCKTYRWNDSTFGGANDFPFCLDLWKEESFFKEVR